nr:AraC family transcriptional regulator [uncultured Carboxylicivirga sp.]
MEHHDQQIISLQEGSGYQYLDILEESYPKGKRTENGFDYELGNDRIKIDISPISKDFELILLQLFLQKSLLVKRLPDEQTDYFHLTLIKEGQVTRQYQNEQKNAEAGTSMGLFLHNGLFPLDSHYPARVGIRSVTFKFSLSGISCLIPEAIPLLQSLFPNDEPKGYHTQVSAELEKLMDDLFFYETLDFGRQALVTSDGLKLYTLLMSSLKNQLDKENLHGLHIDDYKRLLEVKQFILDHLDQKVSMDEMANKFGVSASKLKRDFKALFDCNVGEFYTHAKMDEAYRRLKSGKYTVTEVGYDMGYLNASKFSSMFKKVKGINPKDVIPLQ